MKYPSFRRSTASLVAGGALLTGALLVQGCLQREVKEQQPNTSNVFVEQIVNSEVNEIDLLFVVDNSVSMGDKQEILRKAVPAMVQRLITPNCVNEEGNVVGQSSLVEVTGGETQAQCVTGTPEFTPVNDIHLGVITSSLGGHGSVACSRTEEGTNRDDQGQLIASVRSVGNNGVEGLGFLAWTGGDEDTQDALIADFEEHVAATGEVGCGYEATLEAWYRFLVDPQPPQEIVLVPTDNGGLRSAAATDPNGVTRVNQTLLAQRAAFLRPESLVAVIVLSDENDCSVMDGGAYYGNSSAGWLLTTPARARRDTEPVEAAFLMPVSTEICETNPNDECCRSCLQSGQVPDRCQAQLDAVCTSALTPKEDDTISGANGAAVGDENNVRCFDNKRRFGVDLLYPTQRYVDALTKQQIIDARNGEQVANPLLVSDGGIIRDPGLVFFAGIVGVPWQDLATPETLDVPNRLSLLTAAQLNEPVQLPGDEGPRAYNRWEVILGRPGLAATSSVCRERDDPSCGQQPTPPLDPFMIESITPRSTSLSNPITGQPIVAATSNDPTATINGHEVDHTQPDNFLGDGYDDLQFACIFPLAEPVEEEECLESASCDCQGEPSRNSPLCQPPEGGASAKTQYFGKAYPGTRILRVLKDFGNNSIVSSICPKVIDEAQPDFGYNPAVQAIVDRLSEVLTGACLPRELTVDEDGRVPCFVVEARRPGAADTPLTCDRPGRAVVTPDIRTSVEKQLRDTDRCDGNTDVACSSYEMCTLVELTDEGRDTCLYNEADTEDPTVFTNPGFCYIDPAKQDEEGNYTAGGTPPNGEAGTNPIVDSCPVTSRRLLRFVGPDTPAESAITFVACTGDAAGSDDPIPSLPESTGSMGGGSGG